MKAIFKRSLFASVGILIVVFLFYFFIKPRFQEQFGTIEACYAPDGINFEKKDNIGYLWGGSSGILLKDKTIILGGLDFSSRGGIKDRQTGHSIKDLGFLQSRDGWNFSKFKPEISGLDRTITSCGDPTFIELPKGGYRLYFTDGEKGCHGKASPLLSVYSKDGYTFSFEGMVSGVQGINLKVLDFTVLYEKISGKYYIYTRADNLDEADVLESADGRFFTKRFKIKIPFGFQFSIIDEGDHYVAYGGHIPSDIKPCTDLECSNLNLRYPVKAVSKDGISWARTDEQPIGPWTGDKTYCNTYGVIKMPDGYYFY